MVRFLPAELKPANPVIRSINTINHNQNPEASKGVRFGKWLNRTVTTRVMCWTALPATLFGAAVYHTTSFVIKTVTTPVTVWFSKEHPELGFKDWGKHALKVAACVVSFFVSPWVSLIPVVGPELCVKFNVKLGLASLVDLPNSQKKNPLANDSSELSIDELEVGEKPFVIDSSEPSIGRQKVEEESIFPAEHGDSKIEKPKNTIKKKRSKVKKENDVHLKRKKRKAKKELENKNNENLKNEDVILVSDNNCHQNQPEFVDEVIELRNVQEKKNGNDNEQRELTEVPGKRHIEDHLSAIRKGVELKKVLKEEINVKVDIEKEEENLFAVIKKGARKNREVHKPVSSEGGYQSDDFKDPNTL